MTYDELSIFGRLRKQAYCGPYSMFCKLIHTWRETCSASEVGEEVYIQSELYDVFTSLHRMLGLNRMGNQNLIILNLFLRRGFCFHSKSDVRDIGRNIEGSRN